jgi:hypothetical protein
MDSFYTSECGVTANMSGLGPDDSGFESRHSDQKQKPLKFSGFCFWSECKKPTTWLLSGFEWAERYEVSRPNRERRAASPTSGDEEELVAETPGTARIPYSLWIFSKSFTLPSLVSVLI